MVGNKTCKHEIVDFANGTQSVRNMELGEAMHSSVGPEEEARRVHLQPCRIPERFNERLAGGAPTPFTVFDLGLGIAANALATIDCRLSMPRAATNRNLRVMSFENDLSGLELMMESASGLHPLARYREAVRTLLRDGRWQDDQGFVDWQLISGDFLANPLQGLPAPEAIYFDFYSPKATPEFWGFKTFQKLHDCAGEQRCILTTYSAATRVRAALLLAGFFVGYGEATSAKQETTVASTRLEDLKNPLEADWFEKFNRSARAMPEDLSPENWEAARLGILGSPQGILWSSA